jgi:quercetin dioxygenase-like cupin family protein
MSAALQPLRLAFRLDDDGPHLVEDSHQILALDGAAPWRFLLVHGADLPLPDRGALLLGLLRLMRHEAGDPPGRELHLILQQGEARFEQGTSVGPPAEIEPKWWGSVDVLAETTRAGLYRLNLSPGGRIPTHLHREMDESELVLTDRLIGWSTGGPTAILPRGHTVRWPKGLAHGYQNDSDQMQRILCMDRPPFDARDEVLLEPDAPAPAGPWQAP